MSQTPIVASGEEPFCPLYASAKKCDFQSISNTAHAGLAFEKFANAWSDHEDKKSGKHYPKFDKPPKNATGNRQSWLRRFADSFQTDEKLTEAARRQRELITARQGHVILLTNVERFVTGMGREHPLENGFTWHPTLGVPYLPGSSVKGLLRAWLREEGEYDEAEQRFVQGNQIKTLFGDRPGKNNTAHVGNVVFFDMLPTKSVKLDVDVMTPHYSPYYQGGEVPGDWHNPTPISFLTVAPGTSWQLGIAPRNGRPSESEISELLKDLREALEFARAGAKTAVGYGRFEFDHKAHEQQKREQAEQEQAEKERQQKAAADAAFQAEIENDSPELQQLKQSQRTQKWTRNAGDQIMLQTLSQFADQHEHPPQDCLDWIRAWLESIGGYAGVWNNPIATKGKAKNPKFKSPAIRELVKRLTNK